MKLNYCEQNYYQIKSYFMDDFNSRNNNSNFDNYLI